MPFLEYGLGESDDSLVWYEWSAFPRIPVQYGSSGLGCSSMTEYLLSLCKARVLVKINKYRSSHKSL